MIAVYIQLHIQLCQPCALFRQLRLLGKGLAQLGLGVLQLLPQVAQPDLEAFHSVRHTGQGVVNAGQVALGIGAQGGPVGHLPL